MGGIFKKEEPFKNQIPKQSIPSAQGFSHKTVNIIIKLAST